MPSIRYGFVGGGGEKEFLFDELLVLVGVGKLGLETNGDIFLLMEGG